MEIDFSKYNDEELMEVWSSIDDYKYPERAIKIYNLVTGRGLSTYDDLEANYLISFLSFLLKPLLFAGIGDRSLENELCRQKEQRVLSLINSSKANQA